MSDCKYCELPDPLCACVETREGRVYFGNGFRRKLSIADLRDSIGGDWVADRHGFNWNYAGRVNDMTVTVRGVCALSPSYPGDDDTFEHTWQVGIDGIMGLHADPIAAILRAVNGKSVSDGQ